MARVRLYDTDDEAIGEIILDTAGAGRYFATSNVKIFDMRLLLEDGEELPVCRKQLPVFLVAGSYLWIDLGNI